MKMIKTNTQAIRYLYGHIPSGRKYIFPGGIGLKRTLYLLKLLGSPQNKLKVIHIAGTSGKGSTAFFISTILRSQGFKVGLSVSPHLLDIRERFQINNNLISQKNFIDCLNEIIPAVEETSKTKYGTPTYFEILVVLAYYIFCKLGVDYAVMETGLGGMLDGTNVVSRRDKIAVITKIGHDHTKILGNTLDKIASQKAGIIKPGNIVVTTKQHPKAFGVIKKAAIKNQSKMYVLDRKNVKELSLVPKPTFTFNFENRTIEDIKLQMLGSFQVQNCSLALATAILLSGRDKFILDEKKLKRALGEVEFLGRMQKVVNKGEMIIIDGAHNPQKMKEFTKNLQIYFPDQKFIFLLGFKRGKDYKNILRYIVPLADKIIITSFFNQTKFQGMSVLSEDTKKIAQVLETIGHKKYEIFERSEDALKALIKSKNRVKVITGSLYLISEVYPFLQKDYWY
ncbi:hypothetical protein JXA63_01475 [Candidatus Woesebacteria bacterium]|nr:hypothetical protein [Candidatus Woesebacteria bacterium]